MTLFPLLRLPFLPLTDALKCLNPIELFTLSQCSKKMIETIKLADTRNFHLSVDFWHEKITINEDFRFGIYKKSSDRFKKANILGYRSFGSNDRTFKVPVDPNFINCLDTFWDDPIVGIETIGFYLSKIFGCKIYSFLSENDLQIGKFRPMIEKIMKKQNEIRYLLIKTNDFTDDDLKWTLDSVKVTEEFAILVKTSQNFKYNFKTLPKQIIIHNSSWLTLKNLLSFNSCVYIELWNSHLSNQQLDVFIKLWKTGSYPKLEYLSVQSEYLNDKDPVGGLSIMRNTQNPIIRKKEIMYRIHRIYQGVDIQRDDGVMGTFQLSSECGWLQLLVWN